MNEQKTGGAAEVFGAFLRLGLTSFGGPVAHLGYFREEFVQRRKWLGEREYADLVALCQFLPGPASSQVGMALGLRRAGFAGMAAAWVAFTLPSVLLMVLFALGVANLGDIEGAGWLAGLKVAAVAVVAHAVLGMATNLVTDKWRALIAAAAAIAVLLVTNPFVQVAVIVLGAAAGWALLRRADTPAPDGEGERTAPNRVPRPLAVVCLVLFAAGLVLLPVLNRAVDEVGVQILDTFYRAGALVFGGGHVVLPLLEQATVPAGLVDHNTFLAGYGAAQAVPGPLFTFASFLGASAEGISWWWGAIVATVAIFVPAALLVVGAMPFWETLRHHSAAASVLAGANAAVVGILGAALYTPVFTAGVTGPATMAVALAAFTALQGWKLPAWAVVIASAAVGAVFL
ncbi:chromate efflux transporter [Corynebacterium auris]|uniref:chromate efflux transporter n=1 Tax=Corynebacterium auris TaxID=44750 RepID=UPI0025B4060F|nr:chromate efflux transporter [Corynebacterium auris]WJY67919.1 Chromate transport protein [Corynebacterium auris]